MPVFLGYVVARGTAETARGGAEAAAALIENMRLPLVLDLDETLLEAFTANQLRKHIKDLSAEIDGGNWYASLHSLSSVSTFASCGGLLLPVLLARFWS